MFLYILYVCVNLFIYSLYRRVCEFIHICALIYIHVCKYVCIHVNIYVYKIFVYVCVHA